jgi:membrane protein required for beta-lactamase induction
VNFLAILCALAAEQIIGNWRDDTRPGLLTPLHRYFKLRSPVAVALTILVPALAVGALIATQAPLGRAVLSGLVLFVCLGPRDIASDIHRLVAARANGELNVVDRITRSLHHGPEPEADHRSLLGALFIQSHERVFGVLLWFIAAGPGGAVAYHIASRLPSLQDPDSPALNTAEVAHAAMAWLPARLTAVLFALGGNMDDAVKAWQRLRSEPHPDWRRHTWSLLAAVATASIRTDDEEEAATASFLDSCFREVLRVQNRALLILLAADALMAAGATFA